MFRCSVGHLERSNDESTDDDDDESFFAVIVGPYHRVEGSRGFVMKTRMHQHSMLETALRLPSTTTRDCCVYLHHLSIVTEQCRVASHHWLWCRSLEGHNEITWTLLRPKNHGGGITAVTSRSRKSLLLLQRAPYFRRLFFDCSKFIFFLIIVIVFEKMLDWSYS